MKKWLHILGTAGIGLATVALPDLQSWIGAHPQIGTGLVAAWTVLGQLLRSPIAN